MGKATNDSAKVSATKKMSSTKTLTSRSGGKQTADMRILIALAQKKAMGEETVDRSDIQTLAGIANESSFKVTCGKMRSTGLVTYPDNETLSITQAGMAKIGPEHTADVPTTNEEIHEQVLSTIKNKKSKEIFQFMTDGRTRSKAEIAEAVGYDKNAGSFKTYLGAVTKHMDKFEKNTMFQLKDKYFPYGGRPMV